MSSRCAYGAWIVALTAGAAAVSLSGTAGAGDKGDFEVLVGYSKDAVPRAVEGIAVRPTVSQPVYIHLRNPKVVPRANLAVKLVRIAPDGKAEVVAEAAVAKLPGVQTVPLVFKPAPPPKEAPKNAAPPPKLPEPLVYAPPFVFELWIDDGQKTAKHGLPIFIQQPHEYVGAVAAYVREQNRLAVTVTAQGAVDPPCAVRLQIDRELLPGLLPPKDALLLDQLNRNRGAVELHATNLQFEQGVAPKSGRVYVDVDGYERAFGFQVALDQGVLRGLGEDKRVRIRAPRYFAPKGPPPADPAKPPPAPMPKPPALLPVKLEVDGVLDQDASVEVAFDRNGNGNFARVGTLLPGIRRKTLKLAVGDDGSLVCTPTVKDWELDLDVEGIRGRRTLRVRLLNPAGLSLPLADERDLVLFSTSIDNKFAPLAPDFVENKVVAIFADLFINDAGPEDVRFVELPAKAAPGQKLRLKATARKRDEILQAPIIEVKFYIGDMDKDPIKLPAIRDVPTNTWHADYTVPSTAKEKLPVAVKITTAADLSETAKDTIMIVDAAAVAATGAIIRGVVTWNNIPQPNLEVKLLDAKGKPLKATQASPAGVYAFEEVPPGNYILFSSKVNFRGQRPVAVAKGQALVDKQEIELKRN